MSNQSSDFTILNSASGFSKDIIETQCKQAALKTCALQNAIFNSANFSSIATDTTGIIQIFNVGAEHMLGYTALEALNTLTLANLTDPKEASARAAALSIAFSAPILPDFEALIFKASRGLEDIYELTYIRKDGSRFPVIVLVTALRDEKGNIIGYLFIGTDNTTRKQVSDALAASEGRFRALIDKSHDAITLTAADGQMIYVTPSITKIIGYLPEELIGKDRNLTVHPDDRQLFAPQMEQLNTTPGMVVVIEQRVQHKNGSWRWLECTGTNLLDDPRVGALVGNIRDITERKRLDQALQDQNTELENARCIADKANLAKSDFLSSMSHELRSPLNAILGFAQLMDTDTPPASPSQKASIDQILHAGWYLLELINEILDLAVIESGKLLLSVEPVSLAEVMLECQAMMEPQANKHGLKLIFPKIDDSFLVFADRTRLKQVLINLLSNAIKYNKMGGIVAIDYITGKTKRIRIRVRDTGMGLAPDKLKQLFQPFNRLGQENSAEEGTGIGLVVSKLLVELMGGVIGVESTVGVGSIFWFELSLATELPLTVDKTETTEMAEMPTQTGQPMYTLLYVEDNTANLKLVEQLIARRPNLRLLSANNAMAGIKIAREQQPRLILMDINLPGISGIDALKILRDDPLAAHIPVLAISANAMLDDIKKGLDTGFFSYLTKPINVKAFMETIDMALEFADNQSL